MRTLVLTLAIGLAATACTNEFSLAIAAEAAASTGSPMLDSPELQLAGQSVETTTTSTTTTTTVPPEPITLAFAGDVQMIGSMADQQPLAGVAELLSAPDLTLVNLETVIGEAGEVGSPPIDKKFIFRSPPETLGQLVAAGVDVVALANNHAWDYGPLGARVTRAYVDVSPLIGVGAGADPATAYAPAFVDVDGRTVGIVSLTRVPCDWSNEAAAVRQEIAWACDRFAIAAIGAIARSDAAADITVVMLHGGVEMSDCPDDEFRRVVDVWVETGADVIAVSHPHVLQGVEIIDGTPVLWSTGNFAFRNRGGRTGRSAVFEVTLGGDEPMVTAYPTVLPGGIAEPAEADTAQAVLAEIGDQSRGGRMESDGGFVADDGPSLCD